MFANTKSAVDLIYKRLRNEIGGLLTLHSGHNQAYRDEVMSEFRKNKHILIATDVAGRGIDVKNVSLVINYDCPQTFEKYVHRLGRTGRAGASGHAITLVTEDDLGTVPELTKLIKPSKIHVVHDIDINRVCGHISGHCQFPIISHLSKVGLFGAGNQTNKRINFDTNNNFTSAISFLTHVRNICLRQLSHRKTTKGHHRSPSEWIVTT